MNWIEDLDDLLALVEDTAKGEEGDLITKARGMIQEHRSGPKSGYTALFETNLGIKTINKPSVEDLRSFLSCIGDLKWVQIIKE